MASQAHCRARVYQTYFFYNGWITKKNVKSVPIYGRKKFDHPRHGCQRRLPSSMHYVQSSPATWFHGSCIPVPVLVLLLQHDFMVPVFLSPFPLSTEWRPFSGFRPQGKGKKGRADKWYLAAVTRPLVIDKLTEHQEWGSAIVHASGQHHYYSFSTGQGIKYGYWF